MATRKPGGAIMEGGSIRAIGADRWVLAALLALVLAVNVRNTRVGADTDFGGQFARIAFNLVTTGVHALDRDDDGVLSIADFPDLDAESFRGFYHDQRALRVIGAHFQADEDMAELRLDELEWMITTYDLDHDDMIDAGEFAAGAEEYRREIDDGDDSGTERAMMGDYDPWEVLLEAVDDDDDGRLSAQELMGFFDERGGGDQVLSMRGEASEQSRRPDSSGVPEGEMAPDFSLEPPDGGERVTLSSFRGKKPVALVFGSYT